jgi:hypothetical protein
MIYHLDHINKLVNLTTYLYNSLIPSEKNDTLLRSILFEMLGMVVMLFKIIPIISIITTIYGNEDTRVNDVIMLIDLSYNDINKYYNTFSNIFVEIKEYNIQTDEIREELVNTIHEITEQNDFYTTNSIINYFLEDSQPHQNDDDSNLGIAQIMSLDDDHEIFKIISDIKFLIDSKNKLKNDFELFVKDHANIHEDVKNFFDYMYKEIDILNKNRIYFSLSIQNKLDDYLLLRNVIDGISTTMSCPCKNCEKILLSSVLCIANNDQKFINSIKDFCNIPIR